MDILLNVDAVTSSYNLKGFRCLFDLVESNVRKLRCLGDPLNHMAVLMNNLPQELRLLVSHDIKDGEWELDSMMCVIKREIDATERSNTNPMQRELPTLAKLLSNNLTQPARIVINSTLQAHVRL